MIVGRSRFLSTRSIVSLIGIDHKILARTDFDNRLKFMITGLLVIGIMLISFLSVFYGFELMFHMWHAELLLSAFFSLMFFNIYIFLIQTFSKEVFPTPYKVTFFNLSNLSRLGFVIFIGFLIAQPIKVYVVRENLERDISNYKLSLFKRFSACNSSLYSKEIADLQNRKKHFDNYGTIQIATEEIEKADKRLSEIAISIHRANAKAYYKINQSDFFIKRVEFAARYRLSNIIMLFVVAVFVAPAALIHSISKDSKYYMEKKNADRNLVISHYQSFKRNYSEFFRTKYEMDISFYEHFIDPPFNSQRKIKLPGLTQDDFFKNT